MVYFTIPQMRVEADFFAESEPGYDVWFSVFTGREESQGGEDELRAFILQCEDPEFRRRLEAGDVADDR